MTLLYTKTSFISKPLMKDKLVGHTLLNYYVAMYFT